jgi:thiamine pyrophosphokinase
VTLLLDGVALQIHAAVTDVDACDELLRQATTQVITIAGGLGGRPAG